MYKDKKRDASQGITLFVNDELAPGACPLNFPDHKSDGNAVSKGEKKEDKNGQEKTAPAALGCGWSGRRIEIRGAEGGTRTPMPLRAQRPERCVSTNFTISAGRVILLYLLRRVK